MQPFRDALQPLIDAGDLPGAVVTVDDGPVRHTEVLGTGGPGGRDLDEDAIFRIQSMTKAMTATIALQFVERGELDLDAPVDPLLPELADRRVLRAPDAELDETVAADDPILLRHLLACTSGYGLEMGDTPLARAITERGVSTMSGAPHEVDSGEWLRRLASLPLAFQPGTAWRYHIGYELLAVLLARHAGRPLGELLRERLFEPLGMVDTGFWIPASKAARLVAAVGPGDDGERGVIEPAGAGFYVGEPPFEHSHGELVSTVGDVLRFGRMLRAGGVAPDGTRILTAESVAAMTRDQVPDSAKRDDDFFPGFWEQSGWGYGLSVARGEHEGEYGWSGGYGTHWIADPRTGRIAVLMQQVSMDDPVASRVIDEFEGLARGLELRDRANTMGA